MRNVIKILLAGLSLLGVACGIVRRRLGAKTKKASETREGAGGKEALSSEERENQNV